MPLKKTHIVLHHSATADGPTVSWQAIRHYHVGTNGWSAIGYNFGIELVGDEYEAFVGRSLRLAGAHCKEASMNRVGIGICVVGNFDLAPPDTYQLAALKSLVLDLMLTYGIPPENVIGHRDAGLLAGYDWQRGQYKSCPGKFFPLADFRERLRKGE